MKFNISNVIPAYKNINLVVVNRISEQNKHKHNYEKKLNCGKKNIMHFKKNIIVLNNKFNNL